MKTETLELIHLNTYVDYSANKATDDDINQLLSKFRMKPDEEYLNFLRQLNGFKVYQLNIYGTKMQDDLNVGDVWYYNDYYTDVRPELGDYFIIGDGDAEFYAYHHKEKKYCSLEYKAETVLGGRIFENLAELLDWTVKHYAKRHTEKTKIVSRKGLLHLASQISLCLQAHGFQIDGGNVLINNGYYYLRTTQLATEKVLVSIQTNALRNKLTLTIYVSKRYNLIETFFEIEYIRKAIRRGNTNPTILLYKELPGYQSKFSADEFNDNYEVISNEIVSFIKTHVLRALTRYDDVRFLDSNVNESLNSIGNLEPGNVTWYHKMIIAKLAGNPAYEEIFKSVKAKFENKNQESFNVTLSLNEELQKTSPIKDGLLTRAS